MPPTRPATGDAFEDVLYGSESELEESDDERSAGPSNAQIKGKYVGARLRVDDDEPMDLLQGATSRVTSTCCLHGQTPLFIPTPSRCST
jgi:ribosomal RNA-processing protein 12